MPQRGPLSWDEPCFLLFLEDGEETNSLSVWSCPSFQFIRVSETRRPINYSVLENGDLHLFHVLQSAV